MCEWHMGLNEFLEHLPSGQAEPISHASLKELSGISEQEAEALARRWCNWHEARLRELITKMTALAEEDPLLEFEPILQRALSLEFSAVRAMAVTGLGESNDKRLVRRFTQLLRQDASREVRTAAALSLARFSEWARDGWLIEKDRRRLRAGLRSVIDDRSESFEVRRRSLEAIAPFGGEDVHKRIRAAFESGKAPLVQSAIYAMGRTSDATWLNDVLAALGSHHPATRFEAVRALGEIGDERHAGYLKDALDEDDAQIAVAVAVALGKLGGSVARRLLSAATDSDRPAVAEAAHAALAELNLEDALLEDEPGILGITPEFLAGIQSAPTTSAQEESDDLDEDLPPGPREPGRMGYGRFSQN